MLWCQGKKYKTMSLCKWLIPFGCVLLPFIGPVKIGYNIPLHHYFKGMFSDHKTSINNIVSLLLLAKNSC